MEFIHNLVETLDKYFENVCELDIMFNIEKAHFIIDEMIMSGYIVESNKANVLNPVIAVVKSEGKWINSGIINQTTSANCLSIYVSQLNIGSECNSNFVNIILCFLIE